MIEIPFLPEAEEEFLEWVDRYEGEVRGLGGEFIEEVERALERIATFPEHGSPHLVNTRRVVLQRFPFSVVYDILPEGALVVAVAHHRRRPGYWRERI
ncbi:MAG: type II toxin-antitoxin system RelE/ParE family toxin [Ornithinimicrobium sp.]|uniref:type II toxin-antitoxin system RelE/ParE family toxin n=1 Tax=Ornithinimicrobium sp. TaxID=1977084 RepID=UPI0017B31EE9|nr:type II toxin-antitoxin system RelE/ParE family toxin [Gemmatimonadota bacterium]